MFAIIRGQDLIVGRKTVMHAIDSRLGEIDMKVRKSLFPITREEAILVHVLTGSKQMTYQFPVCISPSTFSVNALRTLTQVVSLV